MRRPFPIRRIITYCGLLIFYLFLLLPIAWLILSSFRNSDSIQSGRLLPAWSELTYQNYIETFQIGNFVTYLVNSFVIAFSVMVLTVFLGSAPVCSLDVDRLLQRHSDRTRSSSIDRRLLAAGSVVSHPLPGRNSRLGGRRVLCVRGFMGRLPVRFDFIPEQRDPDSTDRIANFYDQSARPMGTDHRRDSRCHRTDGDFLFHCAAPIGFRSHRWRG
jgi:hypothetical protein